MQRDRSKLQRNAFGVRKTPSHKQCYSPQLFTIHCHSNCPLHLSWCHISWCCALDVAAGAAQVTDEDLTQTKSMEENLGCTRTELLQ